MLARYQKAIPPYKSHKSPRPPSSASSPLSSPTSPVEITEVLARIFSFLSQWTLRSVVARVCRQWFLVARNLFKRHLILDHKDPKTWKNLDKRLLLADKLTIGGESTIHEGPVARDWDLGLFSREDEMDSWITMEKVLVSALATVAPAAATTTITTKTTTIMATGATAGTTIKTTVTREGEDINNTSRNRRRESEQGSTIDGRMGIKDLVINLGWSWMQPDPLMTQFIRPFSMSLQDLFVDLPYRAGDVHMESILEHCPNLLRLSLRRQLNARGNYLGDDNPRHTYLRAVDRKKSIDRHQPKKDPSPYPYRLQYFLLETIKSTPSALQSFFNVLPRLTDLRIVNVLQTYNETGPDSFLNKDTGEVFWSTLADACPRLETIHFSCLTIGGNPDRERGKFRIPIERFPLVQDWGVGCCYIHPITPKTAADEITPTWSALSIHRIENRLTSLEILADKELFQSASMHPKRTQVLYTFLCQSPLLLHFKVRGYSHSTAVLWGVDEGGYLLERPPASLKRFWTCQQLRTLSIRFENDAIEHENSRSVAILGYISRVCPRLEELSIETGEHFRSPWEGLCLLTRLRRLRQLKFFTKWRAGSPCRTAQRKELCWIQTCALVEEELPRPSNLNNSKNNKNNSKKTSLLSSLLSSTPVLGVRRTATRIAAAVKNRRAAEALLQNYVYTLHMMRTQCFFNRTNGTVVEYNPTDAHWKSVRTEMQEQQRRNRYRTDYDGTVPMVDGLQGFGYCGHYLDIEALLEAQIFCLRALLQQSKKNIWSTNAATMTVIGRQDAQQQPVERKWRQPWPELEQILFTYRIGRGCSKEGIAGQRHLQRECDDFGQLRPGIQVVYRVVEEL